MNLPLSCDPRFIASGEDAALSADHVAALFVEADAVLPAVVRDMAAAFTSFMTHRTTKTYTESSM